MDMNGQAAANAANNDKRRYQVIVIGKGPAGLQAAIYTARAGLSVLVIGLDAGSLGKAETIENYYGFAAPVSGNALQQSGEEQAARFGARILSADVIGVGYGETGFIVSTPEAEHYGETILIATGTSHIKAPIAGIESFEGKGLSYCAVCDGFFFKQKEVGVLGFTDYAAGEALELKALTDKVTIFTNGKELSLSAAMAGRMDAVNMIHTPIARITGEERVSGVELSDGKTIPLDGLFVAYGVAGGADLARKLGLIINGRGEIETDEYQQTNVPGVFAAGDCTGRFRQIAVAVGQGALAAKSIIDYCRGNKAERP